MTINEVKAVISTKTGTNVTKLSFVQQLDKDNQLTSWVSHWDTETRVRVNMHLDVFNLIKADPTGFSGLAIKPMETVDAHLDSAGKEVLPYVKFMIITPKNILGEF